MSSSTVWHSSCRSYLRCLVPPLFFFFNDTATTEIYTLSLHDALPILFRRVGEEAHRDVGDDLAAEPRRERATGGDPSHLHRTEEHTPEIQSQLQPVCRLSLGKKKKTPGTPFHPISTRLTSQILAL